MTVSLECRLGWPQRVTNAGRSLNYNFISESQYYKWGLILTIPFHEDLLTLFCLPNYVRWGTHHLCSISCLEDLNLFFSSGVFPNDCFYHGTKKDSMSPRLTGSTLFSLFASSLPQTALFSGCVNIAVLASTEHVFLQSNSHPVGQCDAHL